MTYKFNEKQKEAQQANKDKRIEKRLEVLELRCEGKSQKEIVEKTRFHRSYVCSLIKKYFEEGLQAVAESHYGGNHKNMSFEEEAEFLEQFRHMAEQGQMLDIHEVENTYREKVGHDIGNAQVYRVLQRHGFVTLSRLYYECQKNLFGNDLTSYCDQKDIMPTKGCTKPFVGINLVKNKIAVP